MKHNGNHIQSAVLLVKIQDEKVQKCLQRTVLKYLRYEYNMLFYHPLARRIRIRTYRKKAVKKCRQKSEHSEEIKIFSAGCFPPCSLFVCFLLGSSLVTKRSMDVEPYLMSCILGHLYHGYRACLCHISISQYPIASNLDAPHAQKISKLLHARRYSAQIQSTSGSHLIFSIFICL